MPKEEPFVQKGVVHLLALFLILAAIAFLALLLVKGGVIKTRVSKDVQVQLASEYQNPFNKDTQYVNPFSEYKNPFDNLR